MRSIWLGLGLILVKFLLASVSTYLPFLNTSVRDLFLIETSIGCELSHVQLTCLLFCLVYKHAIRRFAVCCQFLSESTPFNCLI